MSSTETIILVFLAISLYNVVELTIIIFGTFKRHSGLYFWSCLCASWGIPFCCAGFLVKYYAPASLGYLAISLIIPGWVAMVTGQSLVLWSRLHLVLRNRKRLRMILWMIIIDAVICHGTIIPMAYGAVSSSSEMWVKPFSIMEKIQVTIFFTQEVILSSFYIFETVKLVRLEQRVGKCKSSRRLMNHLIFVNIIIILLDVTILGLEYADYAKLKLEFTILNRLVEMTTGNKDGSSGPRSRTTGTTTDNKTGIALKTFVSNAGDRPRADFSYQAYANRCEERSLEGICPSHVKQDRGVMMTTEIMVKRDHRQYDEIRSIGGKSSADLIIGVAKVADPESLSKSSSEVHLVTRGF
ncbi:hypothetical protein EDB81DRAFT_870323 [Dactylonectria macrodidyma]|uniref:DUF7703 domain-containing protein n=1 Tax=Dactylonectria macrodidyma TaxID=307937 RepID=A0A9P9EFW1_9HYPO|nr:hypothetical protein EDB81DRAFT_870323 [Dactylonectria macrodidyma]